MMNRGTIGEVRALIAEIDTLACAVLDDLDKQNEYGHYEKLDVPRAPSFSDHVMCGNANTGALRRRSMDLTRKLAELRSAER